MINRLLAALLLIAFAASPAVSKECAKKPVRANGNSINPVALVVPPQMARAWAKRAWDKRCVQLYSGIWCNPAMSTGQRHICHKAPNGAGGYKHVCEFEATPCRN